ncbi:MAG: DUF1127 domain-containing protein [Gammaproteobacteria bacterium]|nr:DUF1127 domain-containing protein [Gammaproteobacteria bacterium]NIR82064.1 DUF1127 domain-containing protein [Gammaproteobacteria bacterium]NIR89292.1 DUF1127 domain-containing protein [Gammaproteobacteria bacterium]NIU03174.1 DUF1127 domain-containing protein [Gammaproteobacteria bacterium]NIV50690.1 DUF1127 domain-containing protein [Gammaproteobacteria bacterium]
MATRPEHLDALARYLPYHRVHAEPRRLLRWLLDGMERARQRRELAQLDDRMLRDMGLTRSQARAEARKPFWRK